MILTGHGYKPKCGRNAGRQSLSGAQAVAESDVEVSGLVTHQPNYYLAVIRPENLQRLQEAGLDSYYFKRDRKLNAGDRIVLYRSRGGEGAAGIAGIFEIMMPSDHAVISGCSDAAFEALYPVKVPWRAIALSLKKPMPIAPLVPELRIFTNKKNYGSVLQTTLKSLPRPDYQLIERSFNLHVTQVASDDDSARPTDPQF